MALRTVSSAVEEQLQSLCLRDFPCGHGTWQRKPRRKSSEELDDRRADTEEQEALVELLTSPLSPWQQEGSWSPQASALRELSVRMPSRIHKDFIYSFFTTLRILDKGVSLIDDGLLRFTSLEELVLCANSISELPAEHLPKTLRVLELYANQVSSLRGLSIRPPPHLQHLGLGRNSLGSLGDIQYFTAALWPHLVSLDLSWSGFEGQCVLVDALFTLPRLRTLVLEGNPLTLTPSYPGFVLDSLPNLLYLDGARVTPDDRHRFSGLAQLREAIVEEAAVTVSVLRMRGIPDPSLTLDDGAPEFPLVRCSYSVTYEFLEPPACGNKGNAVAQQTCSDSVTLVADAERQGTVSTNQMPQGHREGEMSSPLPNSDPLTETAGDKKSADVMTHRIPMQTWVDVIEFDHASTHRVRDLVSLKDFFLRGLRVTVEEEKILSWPAMPAENPGAKPAVDKKGAGKECTDSSQKSKDKKKKKDSMLDLIQDAPIRRTLGAAHVDLRELMAGQDRVHVLCDLGVLLSEQSARTAMAREKDQGQKTKEDKKKEDKKAKPGGDGAGVQRNTTSSKGKSKGRKESEPEVPIDEGTPTLVEPLSVEFAVHRERWQSASEAPCLQHP